MFSTLIVGTTGTDQDAQRVQHAAHLAQTRAVPLHVVCSVERMPRAAQRELERSVPADIGWCATDAGQREAAMREVRSLLGGRGLDLRVSATTKELTPALRELAERVDGEVYGADVRRLRLRLPLVRRRARATA